jgi:uncharacterized membrane protein
MVYANPQSDYASIGDKIIFCTGGSDTNYFEYKVTVTNDSNWNHWELIVVNQSGASMSASRTTSDEPTAEIHVEGNPSHDL